MNIFKSFLLYLLISLVFLINFIPTHISYFDIVFINIEIIILYYYFFYITPPIISPVFLFIIGLVHDAILDIQLGITSFSLLLTLKILSYSTKSNLFSYSAYYHIFRVTLVISTAFFIKLALISIYYMELLPIYLIMQKLILSILLYPVFHLIFNLMFKLLNISRTT